MTPAPWHVGLLAAGMAFGASVPPCWYDETVADVQPANRWQAAWTWWPQRAVLRRPVTRGC